ncbi:hypothetical protein D3C77_443850 [compost metagenome]
MTEGLQRQRVVAGLVDAGIDPWPAAGAHELQGIFVGGAGDAGVDRGMKDLRQWADRGRPFEGTLERHHILGGDPDILEQYRAAAGGALAKAAPVVDHLQPGAVGGDKHQLLHALLVDHRSGNALGIERAGGVELAPVDAVAVTVPAQGRGAVMGGFGPKFRQGVTEAFAGQYFGVQALLLLRAAVYPQHFQGIEMVLRNLTQGGIGLGDARDDFGQGNVGNTGAAKGFGDADGPQAGARKQRQFRVWQATFAVAQDAVAAQFAGQFFGNLQSLGVSVDDRDVFVRLRQKAHK